MRQYALAVFVIGLLSFFVPQGTRPPQQPPVLDETIKPMREEPLEYPPLARMASIQGLVVVRAELDGRGEVFSSTAVSGNKILIPVCLSNSLKWRFEPNAANEVVIIYDFRLQGACYFGSPCESQFTFRPPNVATITSGFQVIDHGPAERPRE
jgi:hypothetical protein